ncbi:MAG TPA: hypothetical protein VFY71_09510 [Planctomycetota bacterium]|nr:hypothetical protein [Planctomycetota bacterium]
MVVSWAGAGLATAAAGAASVGGAGGVVGAAGVGGVAGAPGAGATGGAAGLATLTVVVLAGAVAVAGCEMATIAVEPGAAGEVFAAWAAGGVGAALADVAFSELHADAAASGSSRAASARRDAVRVGFKALASGRRRHRTSSGRRHARRLRGDWATGPKAVDACLLG